MNSELVIRTLSSFLNPQKYRDTNAPAASTGCFLHVVGLSVPSEVLEQPLSDADTKQGALNRAVSCFEAYSSRYGINPDFAIGIEGGIAADPLIADA